MAARLRMFFVPRFLKRGCWYCGVSMAVSMAVGCLVIVCICKDRSKISF